MPSLYRCHSMRIAVMACFLTFLAPAKQAAADIRRDADTVTFSGRIAAADFETLSTVLATESVSTIHFKNSGGGSFSYGLRIGKLISEKNIKTVVEGICASACAIAFLGGNPREFSEAQPDSALMIHPGFEPGKQIPAAETKDMLFAWIEARTGRPLAADFIAAMDKIATRKGGIYFLSASHGAVLKSNSTVFICDGTEKNIIDCPGRRDWSADNMQITASSVTR